MHLIIKIHIEAIKNLFILLFADICWLRLDFESMTLAGPSDTVETGGGVCKDTFKITVSHQEEIFKHPQQVIMKR